MTHNPPLANDRLLLDGELVTVLMATPHDDGVDLVVRRSNGVLTERTVSWESLSRAVVAENDGGGEPNQALAGLWGRWMQYTTPRIRSAALATRPLKPFAHQDEAVFDHMLPQPRLRFLLGDEPGTGKTIMTGMYVVEGRRRGLIPGPTIVVVPAHLIQKWQDELQDFFGILASRLSPEVARDPRDLDPRVDVWVTSLDLFTHSTDVRRKVAGSRASWSLAVFDEAHRLTPTSRYLAAAEELAMRSHHLLLLTATPHRGKEHFFRGLCHLLDPEMYPWAPAESSYETRLKPSRLSFLRRMKEELRDLDQTPLFPPRYAKTMAVQLTDDEQSAYGDVMTYAETWYGENATLALSVYGKRAASCLPAVVATLERRLDSLKGPASLRGGRIVTDVVADALRGERDLSTAFEDPDSVADTERVVVSADTKDKVGELEAVQQLLRRLHTVIDQGESPAKWDVTLRLITRHGIAPGVGQALIFTEFADTARWLRSQFLAEGFSCETLEGAVDQRARYELQRAFLGNEFQILVSTDAGGEGINLQSANVMVDWDIPWSLVRLEQRMGRLHRIGQRHPVYVYHLVAPNTREGRVQEVTLKNLEAASDALGGRIFDLLDATVARASGEEFDFARALSQAQLHPSAAVVVPDIETLKKAGAALVDEDRHLRSRVDHVAAEARFHADRLEAINPVIVEAFLDAFANAAGWTVGPGPAAGIRRIRSSRELPVAFGGATDRLVAADVDSISRARDEGVVGIEDVVVLGPTEEAFAQLIQRAVDTGRPELLRGCTITDTGSLTDYLLLVYEAEVRIHDGVRQTSRPTPILVRWSGAGAFQASWESLLKLRAGGATSPRRPTPAQLADGEREARGALRREAQLLKEDRLAWVARAREQLGDLEFRFNEENMRLDRPTRQARAATFRKLTDERLARLTEIEDVRQTGVRLVGWVQVRAGVQRDQLGYDPDAEHVAIAKVIEELTSLGYSVDDRQTAGVGYDLLARHAMTGEQRCVEVKGFTGPMASVWLEQNEWAQALQRGDDYWLYVVEQCGDQPQVRVRTRNPATVFGEGARTVQRFRIPLGQLSQQAERP